LDALDENTDLVTVPTGGNDLQWGMAVGACLARSDAEGAAAVVFVRGLIGTGLPGLLYGVDTRIAAVATNAHIVVTGYPRIFPPEYGDYLNASVAEQMLMNDGADQHHPRCVHRRRKCSGSRLRSPRSWWRMRLDSWWSRVSRRWLGRPVSGSPGPGSGPRSCTGS